MQIEFGLPTGAGGMAAAHSAGTLSKQIKNWARQHNITVIIESDRHDYRHWLVVTFSRPKDYTLFALSWNDTSFMGYQQVASQEGLQQ